MDCLLLDFTSGVQQLPYFTIPSPLRQDSIFSLIFISSTITGKLFIYLNKCHQCILISLRLETGIFDGRPADYLFMLVFNWLLAVIVALFLQIPMLMDPMVMSVLYVWCQLNKDTIVNFWFGTQFKAMYLPWVLFGFNLIISGQS